MTRSSRPPVPRVVLAGLVATCTALVACAGGKTPRPQHTGALPAVDGKLFSQLPSSYTGVTFQNVLEDSRKLNVFTYRNYYNGGGVAIGDLTGDGLPEVVLSSNLGGPRLYLNEGQFRFRDITEEAGIEKGDESWTTGVAMADVDGDGKLDLYVSRAGNATPERRANALWINQGAGADSIPHFVDKAKAMGVADEGYTTHAAFLDYDRDGDLDLFIINNSPRPVSSFGLRNTRNVRDPYGGHKLFRNDGGKFTDVSAKAGIYGSEVGFGLGLAVGDVNNDGWPDVYVSNDFFERDYLFINKGDGTFSEQLDREMPVDTYFSMGMDIADVDDDGWPDVYTTDMLPEDDRRLKLTGMFEGWDVYQAKLKNGYHHQAMRNMLQRNNGDGTFSDVGQLAGVARTDWSWSALLFDMDLDGRKDIFVSNGIAKDVTSQDYVAFLANDETMKEMTNGGTSKVDFGKLVKAMSSTPLSNYAFHQEEPLRFTNQAKAWGLDTPSFSSGAAYGDLDGDGAPDLVVNNVNGEAFVYRNNARTLHADRHWLQVRLEGQGANSRALGARVTLHAGGALHMQELSPTRGFESSVDYVLSFGLGTAATVDTLTVDWPDGRRSTMTAVAADRRLTIAQKDAPAGGAIAPARPPFAPAPDAAAAATRLALVADSTAIPFSHRENDFVDFDRDRMVPRLLSTEGPAMATADVNGDGLDDLYIGGAKDQPGRLLLQQPDGRFVAASPEVFDRDSLPEDVGAVFLDANRDGRPDLYVASGGSEWSEGATGLQDRLYLNDGNGRFHKATDAVPYEDASGSRPAVGDLDGDGAPDLFVGGRLQPGKYGEPGTSLLLRNDGRGHFTDVTEKLAPGLRDVGMVTDAVWQDVDGDGRQDLVVVGEWMPIAVFHNAGGRLVRQEVAGLAKSDGWWNRIVATDVDGDGRMDFVVGNLGLNSTRLHGSATEPATMFVKDFDNNGYLDQVVATYEGGRLSPMLLRDDMIRALTFLKARNLKYGDYASRGIAELFTPAELAGARELHAYTFATSVLHNDGGGKLSLVPLPREAQLAPVYGILATDVDGDRRADLLLAGNFGGFKPEIGRMAASFGLLLTNDGKGGFTPVRGTASGFHVPGETRDLRRLRARDGALVVAARNNDRPLAFRLTPGGAAPRQAPGTRLPEKTIASRTSPKEP